MVVDLVAVRGAPTYLHLEGTDVALHALICQLGEALADGSSVHVRVQPDARRVSVTPPLTGLGIRIAEGPVRIEVNDSVGVLVGGAQELTKFLEQMQVMSSGGPQHHEILRVFDDWYAYIDESTHIDLIITS